MKVDHIVQFSPLVRDMDASLDAVHDFLGAFPSRRNHLVATGVDLAIIPFGNETFMELVCPFEPASAGARLLKRSGEGWFMLNIDLDDSQPVEEIDRELRASGARIVAGGADTERGSGSWHLHPADCAGILLAFYVRPDRPDHVDWAGPTWKHFEATNRRVIDRILGVSLATPDIEETASLYSGFGFSFGDPFTEDGDRVMHANLRGGTFLQLRTPDRDGTPLATWLAERGTGLYHLSLGVRSWDELDRRLARVDAEAVPHRAPAGSKWYRVAGVLGMPLEFQEVRG